MGAEISCPQCGWRVLPQKRYCEHCGLDLAAATVIVEQSITTSMIAPVDQLRPGLPIAPEILVPRIGDTLIEHGWILPEDLQRALEYQQESLASGQPILLGQALLELDLVSKEALDHVITTQILQLQQALSDANAHLKERVQEATRDLQKALERLSELNQLKSNFIANVSHELRTPLTHIKGYLDILLEGGLGPLTHEQSEAMLVIRRAEERLEGLIEDLIQFSLAARGDFSLNIDTVQIDRMVNVIIERSNQKARRRNITLETSFPETAPLVKVDEDKLSWALLQLVDNAIKFTPEGGRVEIRATDSEALLTLAVIDSGIGIPEEQVEEIFEPFHQLDGSTTRKYSGTGLGLAMVRRIIEAHGSQIKVKSVVNEGSSFEFSLPLITAGA